MKDIKLIKDVNDDFTIGITDGDFVDEDGFDTAINISLFTDAPAPDGRIKDTKNNHNWMGNSVSEVKGRLLGSWLWLLDMARLTPDTRNKAVNYASLALNWFVEDKLAESVIVTGEIIPRTGIELTIIITHNNGEVTTHYRPLWEKTGNVN